MSQPGVNLSPARVIDRSHGLLVCGHDATIRAPIGHDEESAEVATWDGEDGAHAIVISAPESIETCVGMPLYERATVSVKAAPFSVITIGGKAVP